MDAVGPRQERVCPDCRGSQFVEDHAAGDIVCRGCGLVVEARVIDERSEWRTFGDKEKEGDDPNRVGAAADLLFEDGGLSTGIGRVPGDGGISNTLARLHNRQNVTDRTLQNAYRSISALGDRLGLVDGIKRKATEVFKQVLDEKAVKGRSYQSIYAACIYVACRAEGTPRTFKEIGAVVPEASKKDIARCFNAIDRMIKAEKLKAHEAKGTGAGGSAAAAAAAVADGSATGQAVSGKTTNAVDIMRRFMSNLGFAAVEAMAAQRTAEAARKLGEESVTPWSGKNPATVASVVIYAINWLHKVKNPGKAELLSLDDIAAVTGMAPATIRDGFRDMLPFLVSGQLVPDTFATKEQLRELEGALAAEEAAKAESKARAKAAKLRTAPAGAMQPPGALRQ